MSRAGAAARAVLPAAVGALVCVGSLDAQARSLTGSVADTAGSPVADQVIVLHRVASDGGVEIDRATSDREGRFELQLPEDDGDGLYFAATRYGGNLYIGPPFRPPEIPATYRVMVGGPDALTSLGAARSPRRSSTAATPASTTATRWWWLGTAGLAVLVLLGIAGWVHRRPPEVRRLLLELAELDERHANGASEPAGAAAYQRERRSLRRRLKETVAG